MKKRTARDRQIALARKRHKHELRKRSKVTSKNDTGVYYDGIDFIPTPNRMAMFRRKKRST